jgi:ACS family glucarate transporter-like MFS transporter
LEAPAAPGLSERKSGGFATPVAIGYLVQNTGSFSAAMLFLAANALAAIFCYLFLVGEIRRVELKMA